MQTTTIPTSHTISVVGLGAMGGSLAARLLQQGCSVHGTNRTAGRAAPLVDRGLVWQETPRQAAAVADVVITMVTDDAALKAVVEGDDGILAGLRPGTLLINMSTVSPSASRSVAAQVAARGASMLEAPVSGSVPAAEQGTLTIIVAGEAHVFDDAEPLLRSLGTTVTYVGEIGRALMLKLAVNVSLAAQMLAFSEGLLFAERAGIDRELATSVMADSAIGSPMLRARVPLLLEPLPQSWFSVSLMDKDLRLARRVAGDLGVDLPTGSAAHQLMALAEDEGRGNDDIAYALDVLPTPSAKARREAGRGQTPAGSDPEPFASDQGLTPIGV
jgi:3-hydroxyisobutyrate dehydrogenase-like beta-hydroxyacid dehydrogenase